MTRIAILTTGAPPETLRPAYGDYPAMFGRLLGPDFETRAFDVRAGDLPDPAALDGALITGSPAGVYEADAWIGGLMDWLRGARGRTRLVGVCFGHQALAQAWGGRVEKVDRGWGVGLHRYAVVARPPWMDPQAEAFCIPVSHQDQVVAAPPDAEVVARSDFTPHAALAYGTDAISFQGHPEFDPAFAAALVEGRRGRIPDGQIDEAVQSLDGSNDRALVGGWIRRFLAGEAARAT